MKYGGWGGGHISKFWVNTIVSPKRKHIALVSAVKVENMLIFGRETHIIKVGKELLFLFNFDLEVYVMVKMNEIISNNIMNVMKQNDKKQIDLSGYLNVSKQVVSKMLSGASVLTR